MRARGRVRHQAAAVERRGGRNPAGARGGYPQGERACVAIAHHAESRPRQDRVMPDQNIHVVRSIACNGLGRQRRRELRKALAEDVLTVAGLALEDRGTGGSIEHIGHQDHVALGGQLAGHIVVSRTYAADVGQVQDARPLALSFRPVNECIGGPAVHCNLDFFLDHFLLARAGGTEVPRGLKSALHYLTMRGLTPCCSTACCSAGRSLC